ncbi:MAG: ATP-binding protein [Anaerolineae bacterium]|nr:ATP-binding protein [Anaerolineae bacterium]
MRLDTLVEDLDSELPDSPVVRPGGSLLMMVGLPGTGKSSVVNALQPMMPHVVIATDKIRSSIRESPVYTASEVMLVYEVCYGIIERRLRKGERVVFDGSNLLVARRDYLQKLARRCGAPVAICYVQASQEVIQQRLRARALRGHSNMDKSDADWAVYKWMVEAQEPLAEDHLIVDTTDSSPQKLAQNLYEYWLNVEKNAASDPDLQSPGWASKLSRLYGVNR